MAISNVSLNNITTQTIVGTHTNDVLMATSTNINQSGFKYVVDVYITGMNFYGQSYIRFFVPANPADGKLYMNLSNVLKDVFVINTNYKLKSNALSINVFPNTDKHGNTFTIKIGEAYYTDPTTYTIFPDLATFNGSLFPFMYYVAAPDMANAFSGKNYDDKWHPHIWQRGIISRTSHHYAEKYFNTTYNYWWFYYTPDADEVSFDKTGIVLRLADKNGVLTTYDALTFGALIGIGTASIAGVINTSYNSFNLYNVINSTQAVNLQVYHNKDGSAGGTLIPVFVADDANPTSTSIHNVVTPCNETEGCILYWLNEYGTISHFYFDKLQRSYTNRRETILNKTSLMDGSSYTAINQHSANYYNQVQMNTDVVTYSTTEETDAVVLRSLLSSRYVYMNDYYNKQLRRVILTNTSYKSFTYRSDRVWQFQFQINEGLAVT